MTLDALAIDRYILRIGYQKQSAFEPLVTIFSSAVLYNENSNGRAISRLAPQA